MTDAYDSAMGALRIGFAAGVLFAISIEVATVAVISIYRKWPDHTAPAKEPKP